MKDDFINEIWEILEKYISIEKIISKTKYPNKYREIEPIKSSMIKYWLNPDISMAKKENAILPWVEKFLNSQELFDYNLEMFGNFYNEISTLLSKNTFWIEPSFYDPTYFKIETPAMEKNMSELYEQQLCEINDLEDKKQVLERDELVIKQNQKLLLSFIESLEIYLKILKEYFNGQEITILKEKQFVKVVVSIKNYARKLSLGISSIDLKNLDIIIPFGSLYSLREDWNDAIEKDTKDRWSDIFTLKNIDFTFENIQSILGPLLKKLSSFIDEGIIENNIVLNKSINYITKENDDFKYKGKMLSLSKKANYYKVFCALYALLPDGGEIEYKELIKEIKSRIQSTKSKTDEEMRKFIQSNLTEKSNGFMRYAKVPKTEDNSKPLIEAIKGFGINFNNKAG